MPVAAEVLIKGGHHKGESWGTSKAEVVKNVAVVVYDRSPAPIIVGAKIIAEAAYYMGEKLGFNKTIIDAMIKDRRQKNPVAKPQFSKLKIFLFVFMISLRQFYII